jgi:hypothetical protein
MPTLALFAPSPPPVEEDGEFRQLVIEFGNVTKWGGRILDWMHLRPPEVMAFLATELHLQGSRLNMARRQASKLGWSSYAQPAVANNPAANSPFANTGGECVFIRKGLVSYGHGGLSQPGWRAAFIRTQGTDVLLVALYFLTGTGGEVNEANQERLTSLSTMLKTLKVPWVICGDWNSTPGEVASWPWIVFLRALVLVPDAPFTCRSNTNDGEGGRIIDFVVASPLLEGMVQVEVDWEVPWGPHCALRLHISMPSSREVTSMCTVPDDIPKCYGPRLHSWSACAQESTSLQVNLGLPLDEVDFQKELTGRYASFSATAEAWMGQTWIDYNDKAAGRGRLIAPTERSVVPCNKVEHVYASPCQHFWGTCTSLARTFFHLIGSGQKGSTLDSISALLGGKLSSVVQHWPLRASESPEDFLAKAHQLLNAPNPEEARTFKDRCGDNLTLIGR